MPPALPTRDRLINSARYLFWERGFAGTSMADLLAHADVNSGSFYHFFESKEALLREVLEGYLHALRPMVVDPAFAADRRARRAHLRHPRRIPRPHPPDRMPLRLPPRPPRPRDRPRKPPRPQTHRRKLPGLDHRRPRVHRPGQTSPPQRHRPRRPRHLRPRRHGRRRHDLPLLRLRRPLRPRRQTTPPALRAPPGRPKVSDKAEACKIKSLTGNGVSLNLGVLEL